MLSVVGDEQARSELALDLDELVLQGARRLLAAALEAEVAAYIEAYAQERDERGHRLVRRNGHARERTIATGAGPIPVAAPRVDDRRLDPVTGHKASFASAILPPWCRKSPKVSEVLPLLYLHGLSSSDFVPALEGFFGSAAGLSASVVTRLTAQWQAEREAFMARCLDDRDYVYIWADGVHVNVRLAEERLCWLVIVGARLDGTKELVAVADGYRSPLTPGLRCCATSADAGWVPRWSRSATERWGCGRRWVRSSPRPGRNAAGFTRRPMSWRPCPSRSMGACAGRWLRSVTPRTVTTPWRRSGPSRATTGPSGPRQWPRSSTTPKPCSPSTTSRSSIGCTSRPPIRWSPPSRPCGSGLV